MTRYPLWKRREINQKWRSLLAVLITTVLIFALFNGLIRAFSIKSYLGAQSWDGSGSLAILLGTLPAPTIFIYQPEMPAVAYLTFDPDIYLPSGGANGSLATASQVLQDQNLGDVKNRLTASTRINISGYLALEEETGASDDSLTGVFKNLASFTSPLAILRSGRPVGVSETDMTRADLLRLWWHMKGLGTDNVKIIKSDRFLLEIINSAGNKVFAIDSDFLQKEISGFLENQKISRSDFKIIIENASGWRDAGSLASGLASSVGFSVVRVETAEAQVDKSQLQSQEPDVYGARYLAGLFRCGIFGLSKGQSAQNSATLILGRDFAARFR